MAKSGRIAKRSAASGKFSVVKARKSASGGETWTISAAGKGGGTETFVTSSSSAASLDRIAKTHGKSLKRLADK